jgi:hypothetical protein
LENLEERSLLSTYEISEFVLTNLTHNFNIPVVSETVNNVRTDYFNPPSPFVVNTGGGSNTVNILDTSAGIAINEIGFGSDTVNVGHDRSVQDIVAPVTIQNPPSYNTINVDDSADATARAVTLSTYSSGGWNWGSITGLAPAAIKYKYYDTSSVNITTGSGANTVNVLATGVATYLSSDGGADTVNVGDGGSVQDILGDLYIENPGWHHTTLNIDDSADATARAVTLSTFSSGWGSITGLAPAAINYKYFGTSSVQLTTGSGGDTVNVLATGVATYLSSNGGADTVNVGNGGNVQDILGDLYIENPGWHHTALNIDDSADPTARTVALKTITLGFDPDSPWGSITGLAPAAISYEYGDTSSVQLTTGSGGDWVNVLATGVATYLSSNGGADTVNVGNHGSVQDILGDLYIENPPWFTTLNVDDSADATARAVTLSTFSSGWGSITGLAPAAIDYKYFDTRSVQLTTGSGGDTVNVLATGVATYLNSGGGWDTVNVGSNGLVQGILGDLYIENSPSYTTLNIDDSADPTVHTYTLSTITPGFDPVPWGSITGLAPAAINFEWDDVNSPVNISTSQTVSYTALLNADYPNVRVFVEDNGYVINEYLT